MFSLILKNIGHKSTMRPLMLQTRNFKRDITNEDLNDLEFIKKFDSPIIEESNQFIKNNFDVENEKWCDDDKVYTDRED